MEEEKASQPEGAAGSSHSSAEPAAAGNISLARKIRLAVLVCILVALALATVWYRAKQHRLEEQHEQAIAETLEELREAIRALDPDVGLEMYQARYSRAWELWSRLEELYAGSLTPEALRLDVALAYIGPRQAEVADIFNSLDTKEIATELDMPTFHAAAGALDPFPQLKQSAASEKIESQGAAHLNRCALLWSLARAVTKSATTDTEKALKLCRWVALHLLPERLADLPADPYMVVHRGYGSPEELAWACAELGRQAGLRCKVAIVPPADAQGSEQYFVQVYPADGAAFLVDPTLGVPVVDLVSGKLLSLADVADRPQAYAAFLALTGQAPADAAGRFGAAELRSALDPHACYPRFLVFDLLLSELPKHPHVSVSGQLGPGDSLDLWEAPLKVLAQMRSREYAEAVAAAYAPLQMVSSPRGLQLHGLYSTANREYEAIVVDLDNKLAEADVEVLRRVECLRRRQLRGG
ncbi:MAG: hypothetical protein ACYS8L_04440 [Planctomycetota bacterium]|jgi:hypothetical protein